MEIEQTFTQNSNFNSPKHITTALKDKIYFPALRFYVVIAYRDKLLIIKQPSRHENDELFTSRHGKKEVEWINHTIRVVFDLRQ